MGCSFFDYLQKEESKDFATVFDNAMIPHSYCTVALMESEVDFTRFPRIADIGEGLDTVFSAVLERSPDAHGLLFDVPRVIERAKSIHPNAFERKQIAPDRYEFVAGDMCSRQKRFRRSIPETHAIDLTMLAVIGAGERAIKQFEDLLEQNGYPIKHLHKTSFSSYPN